MAFVLGGGFGFVVIGPTAAQLLSLPVAGNLAYAIVVAIAIGTSIGWAVERLLQTIWPSGRRLLIAQSEIKLFSGVSVRARIDLNQLPKVTFWYFVVNANQPWVQKGSFCLATRLEEETGAITAYCFMPPKEASLLPHWPRFTLLRPAKSSHALGESTDGALRAAENDRWRNGVEMTSTDFRQFLLQLDRLIPAAGLGSKAAKTDLD